MLAKINEIWMKFVLIKKFNSEIDLSLGINAK